jgi:uncharacterized protein (DUF488 family)
MATVYTVGHSTLTQEQFLELLAHVPVTLVWDVRSYPVSHWEWFRRAQLERWLPAAGVEYRWVAALGGRRGPPPAQASAAPDAGEPPAGWTVEGFVNYEWHTLADEFRAAVEELVRTAARTPVAIMCAEGVWWRCHRSMVADYLVVRGAEVVHLQPRRTRHAEVIGERLARYRPATLAAWRAQGPFTVD